MIKNLHIQNFKSIKDLKLDCSRLNVFIGEPILNRLSLKKLYVKILKYIRNRKKQLFFSFLSET